MYQVTAGNTPRLLPEEATRDKAVKGEAVAVDIAPGRTLFALLKTTNGMRDDMAQMSMAALDLAYNNDWVESAGRIAAGTGIRSSAEVAPSDYPMLVTFTDTRDPKSVTRVDPADMAATFGPGVKLRRITMAVTDEKVTGGIGERLGWISNKFYFDKMLDGQTTNDGSSLANDLTPSSFLQGSKL